MSEVKMSEVKMWVILDALLSSVMVSPHVLRDLPCGFLPAIYNILYKYMHIIFFACVSGLKSECVFMYVLVIYVDVLCVYDSCVCLKLVSDTCNTLGMTEYKNMFLKLNVVFCSNIPNQLV